MRKEMKGLWVVAVAMCFLVISAVSHGSVIYQFVEAGSGAIKGELEFLDSVASATTGWTAPLGNLSTLLQGGISGFRWDSGFGLESAVFGDLPIYDIAGDFGSSSGSSDWCGLFFDSVFWRSTVNFLNFFGCFLSYAFFRLDCISEVVGFCRLPRPPSPNRAHWFCLASVCLVF